MTWPGRRGELPPPVRANLVFGVLGGIDATPEAVEAMLRPLVEESDRVFAVNARGPFLVTQAALPLLSAAGEARVITLGTIMTRGKFEPLELNRALFARESPFLSSSQACMTLKSVELLSRSDAPTG